MGLRAAITMACEVCGARNYRTTRARKADTKPLELKKFCTRCNRHTVHKETK